MSDKCNCGEATNVSCCVVGCKYHGENNCCHASCIEVENGKATQKGETFCNTFKQKY